MRRAMAALLGFISLADAAAAQMASSEAARLDGIWQVAEVIALADPARAEAAQAGRLLQLGPQALIALDGAGCAGPTLEPLAAALQRAGEEVAAWLTTMDAAGISGADQSGIVGFCLGDLFAIYVPQEDGSMLAADRVALYRLQRLGSGAAGSGAAGSGATP